MIRIITDSVASIPKALAEELNIKVVSLYVNRDGVEYRDADMDHDEFYRDIYDMVNNIPISSQPSQFEMEEAFEEAAEAGDSALGIFLSSRMSGTYDAAVRAARIVASRYPDFEYRLVDGMSNSFDEAWPIMEAVAARDVGEDLDSCEKAALRAIPRTRFLFSPETLTFLHKGGRIGGAAALLGNMIQLAPILTVRDGEATTFAKVRSRKKALDKMATSFKADIDAYGLRDVVVHYIGDKEPAIKWAKEVISPMVGRTVGVVPVSPVIGLHVGPAVGIAYECEKPIPGKITHGVDESIALRLAAALSERIESRLPDLPDLTKLKSRILHDHER